MVTFVRLEGLTPDESLAMFESVVFSSDSELSKDERSRVLDSEIVPKILSKCANIPCVIKTLALILSTKTSLDEWTHFLDVVWSSVMDPLNMITSTFNLVAFKRLSFLMKRCLLYCSLFPKDYEFDRVDLNIWLAREVKFEKKFKTVDVELIGDIYLQILSQIGYFVEHGKDEDGNSTYKMPDFSYEFVKSMAKLDYSEYQSVGVGTFNVDPTTIRHVSIIVDDASWHLPPWLHEAKRLQSILFLGKHCQCLTSVEDLIPSLKYLQILSGHVEISERLLRNIGNLELLKSLRLRSKNPKLLIEIITRMQNLKLLDLRHLENIYVLPKEFHKLLFLRHLSVRFNLNNQVIPSSGELLSLTKFNVFITGQDNELHTLVDYGYIVENQKIDHEERNEALNDTKFSNIALCWESPCHRDDDIVVKALEAPTSLKNMTIRCWKGLTVPRFLGLVSLQIMDCHECRLLPSFSTLPELKSFKLWNLDALEYIENVDYHEDEPYFKSLETLILGNLPKVKAWKEHDKFKNKLIRQLTKLQISNSKLESLPLLMGKIVSLEVKDISVELLKSLINSTNTSRRIVIAFRETTPMLKTLSISVVHELECIRIALPVFESLIIRQCHQLLDLSVDTDSTLKLLQVQDCGKLRKISNYLPQLIKIEKLEIHSCEELDLQDIEIWESLNNHLQNLTLVNFAHLESLPSSLDCLTMLETLSMSWIYNLKELPECIGRLQHLYRVVVRNCPRLTTVPESLGNLMNVSTTLEVEFRSCRALKRLPKSFPRNQTSRLIIKECPALERSISQDAV